MAALWQGFVVHAAAAALRPAASPPKTVAQRPRRQLLQVQVQLVLVPTAATVAVPVPVGAPSVAAAAVVGDVVTATNGNDNNNRNYNSNYNDGAVIHRVVAGNNRSNSSSGPLLRRRLEWC